MYRSCELENKESLIVHSYFLAHSFTVCVFFGGGGSDADAVGTVSVKSIKMPPFATCRRNERLPVSTVLNSVLYSASWQQLLC